MGWGEGREGDVRALWWWWCVCVYVGEGGRGDAECRGRCRRQGSPTLLLALYASVPLIKHLHNRGVFNLANAQLIIARYHFNLQR